MRASLAIAIIAMGLLAMAVPIWSQNLYRAVVGESQESALEQQLRTAVYSEHRDFERQVRDFGRTLQFDPEFMRAVAQVGS